MAGAIPHCLLQHLPLRFRPENALYENITFTYIDMRYEKRLLAATMRIFMRDQNEQTKMSVIFKIR